MDRCPKDEPTGKNLVCKKALPISEKNWKNLLGGGGKWHPLPPWPLEGSVWTLILFKIRHDFFYIFLTTANQNKLTLFSYVLHPCHWLIKRGSNRWFFPSVMVKAFMILYMTGFQNYVVILRITLDCGPMDDTTKRGG